MCVWMFIGTGRHIHGGSIASITRVLQHMIERQIVSMLAVAGRQQTPVAACTRTGALQVRAHEHAGLVIPPVDNRAATAPSPFPALWGLASLPRRPSAAVTPERLVGALAAAACCVCATPLSLMRRRPRHASCQAAAAWQAAWRLKGRMKLCSQM